jgi:carbon monoxide dehydrogenase subunit G
VTVEVPAETAWRAIRDVASTHELFPGVLTACRLEDGARVVTFANGLVVRELIVDIDESRRRLAYAAVGGRLTHHNASLQVFETAAGTSRIEWIADFLPEAMKEAVAGLMDQGAAALQVALADDTV